MAVAYVGMRTPWGRADFVEILAEGIVSVNTPSHGGIKLSRERQAAMPPSMRCDGGWYEEDCDWCLPFVVYQLDIQTHGDPYAVRAILKGYHLDTFRRWHPDAFEAYFETTLQPGESYVKDERIKAAAGEEHDPAAVL